MIFYFSATGNSKYCAQLLAKRLDDEAVSLNTLIKNGEQMVFGAEKPNVVVAPIYAWRLPLPVEKELMNARLDGKGRVWFIATMGAQSGNADAHCKKICESIGLEYMGFRGICMPDSYVALYDMESPEEAHRKLFDAESEINSAADAVAAGLVLKKSDKTPLAGLMSGAVNKIFNSLFTSDSGFYVTSACTGCGGCVRRCVMNNIELKDGKPVFLHNCIHCMACIQNCPVRGIEIKGKTEKRGRYTCPALQAEGRET